MVRRLFLVVCIVSPNYVCSYIVCAIGSELGKFTSVAGFPSVHILRVFSSTFLPIPCLGIGVDFHVLYRKL